MELIYPAVAVVVPVSWLAIKLALKMMADRRELRRMSDDQLLANLRWERAEGQSGEKFSDEYQRRHGDARSIPTKRLDAAATELTKAGAHDNAYSRELLRRCVKED